MEYGGVMLAKPQVLKSKETLLKSGFGGDSLRVLVEGCARMRTPKRGKRVSGLLVVKGYGGRKANGFKPP